MSVRVLIVDDNELVRDGLRMVLDPAPGFEVVGEAADGAAGVAEATRLRPDVVLMPRSEPAPASEWRSYWRSSACATACTPCSRPAGPRSPCRAWRPTR